jgi:hypothetical protein
MERGNCNRDVTAGAMRLRPDAATADAIHERASANNTLPIRELAWVCRFRAFRLRGMVTGEVISSLTSLSPIPAGVPQGSISALDFTFGFVIKAPFTATALVGEVMFNALDRAWRYRDLADEYCHLAGATGLSTECRKRYVRAAEHYNALAEAEEELTLPARTVVNIGRISRRCRFLSFPSAPSGPHFDRSAANSRRHAISHHEPNVGRSTSFG